MRTIDAGKRGEEIAEKALHKAGMKTLARNYRFGHCELDLVMQERKTGTIVFVEVKARSNDTVVFPRQSVTWKKQQNLRKAALGYCAENGLTEQPCRFDVVEVWLDDAHVEQFENAF